MKVQPAIKKLEVNKDGKVNIKIRISHNYGTRFLSTKFYVLPNQFKKLGTVVKHPNAHFINNEIKNICIDYENRLIKFATDKHVTITQIIAFLTEGEKPHDFESNFVKFIESKKELNERTAKIYSDTLTKIKKYDQRPLLFEDINAGWLRSFENSMIVSGMKTNSIAIHFRNICAVFNYAINNDIIDQNTYPFRRFKIKRGQTPKRSITIDQIRKIRDFETTVPMIAEARDYFMLSFYLIGINTQDLYDLTTCKDGRAEYTRAKTHRKYSIWIEPEAATLIEKLKGTKTLLSLCDKHTTTLRATQQLNRGLALIIPGVTMYAARHSWATIASNQCNATDDDIAAALGHTRHTVTDSYINRDPAIVDRLNRNVLNCLI